MPPLHPATGGVLCRRLRACAQSRVRPEAEPIWRHDPQRRGRRRHLLAADADPHRARQSRLRQRDLRLASLHVGLHRLRADDRRLRLSAARRPSIRAFRAMVHAPQRAAAHGVRTFVRARRWQCHFNGLDLSWLLGNYEILEQIGCGGMGVIYRARQRHSRRIVAVKRVLSYRADSHGALERFRREAQAVASLDHPNILPIYEVNESEDGLPFFSMKFAEKGSLHENVASLRDEPRKCVQLMLKVARAVEYAHSRGVLHRDIKPGNILLNDRGEPLVSDFGLAKLLDGSSDLTRSLTTLGTAGFIAPEQADGAPGDVTPAADVYSLGAVLFNLLAGRPPFLGSNPVSVIRKASETQAPKLRSLVPSLSRDLETICARCLERNPKARYQSAGDLAADLERWLDRRPIIARPGFNSSADLAMVAP